MKFKLTTSGWLYGEREKLLLEKFGFTFTLFDENNKTYHKNTDETEIEINSLEELCDFSGEWGDLVFNNDSIEIYDDYRE